MRSYSFTAALEQDEDGRWSAWIGRLPGCSAWGNTREEALDALRDATQAYILDMIDADEPVPREKPEPGGDSLVTVRV